MKYLRLKFANIILILSVSLLSFSCGNDDNPVNNVEATVFEKTYGGANGEVGVSGVQTSDGGYIVAGDINYPNTADSSDIYLLKVDSKGNIMWERTYGGFRADRCSEVKELPGGGYILAGFTASFGGSDFDIYLLKIDINGNVVWERTFDTGIDEYSQSVCLSSDGGFIINGIQVDNVTLIYIFKVDNNGTVVWESNFSEGNCYSMENTSDGNYILSGQDSGLFVMKINDNGDSLWRKSYFELDDTKGLAISPTSDNGFVLTGYTQSGTGSDMYLMRTDMNGDSLWTNTFGGTLSDVGYSVKQSADGGYIVTGYTESLGSGAKDVYLVKTDSDGEEIWYRTFGTSGEEIGNSVSLTRDGGFVIVGEKNSDAYLIKTDANGNVE